MVFDIAFMSGQGLSLRVVPFIYLQYPNDNMELDWLLAGRSMAQ